jgi:protein phosphatase
MLTFDSACRASQGARKYQEDTALVWAGPDNATSTGASGELIAVLADGMGGHTSGALASKLACERFLKAIHGQAATTRDALAGALMAANEALAEEIDSRPALAGMGTTLVGTHFGPSGLEWVSVGDSPLYLWRAGEIALLNADHSLAPALDEQAARGVISYETARNDPSRHLLRSAVTGGDIELVDLSSRPLSLASGDIVVLASDGIHTLDEADIARLITAYGPDGPTALAEAMLRAVASARYAYQDNVTVVVVRVSA